MKELSIEQKAQRYDEAFEKARCYYTGANGNEDMITITTTIFPELKESEDGRIKEELILYLKGITFTTIERAEQVRNWIAWLEKQGEQKTVDDLTQQEAMDIAVAKCFEQGEQKLNVNDNAKEMFIKALERVEEQNAKGYKLTDCDKNSWWEDFKAYTTSKQILANSAKTCKDEQNPAWNEEDEKILNTIINDIQERHPEVMWKINAGSTVVVSTQYIIDFLKSLKDRYTWKPSDEQMEFLKKCIEAYNEVTFPTEVRVLSSLYNDLKQL